jgi:hypothetical protein
MAPGTVIAPGGFVVFFQSATGVALNDDGDSARLLRPDGTPADEIAYATAAAGVSVARLPDGGAWGSGTPTAGGPNQAAAGPETPKAVAVGEFRGWPVGAWVSAVARVSVLPGTFSARTLHLQDATGGVTVYLGRNDWPPLALGQGLGVLGYLRERNGELELYVRDGWHVHPEPAEAAVPPVPWRVSTGQVGEGTEGALVTVEGRVIEVEAQALWLDDGGGPARIFFAAAAGVARPAAGLGETWRVTGVVVEFTPAGSAGPRYRLQPRWAADLARIVAGQAVPYFPAASATPGAEAPEPTATAVP